MKNKSLDEIDENFKRVFEMELSSLRKKLSDFKKRGDVSKHEKDFKKKLKSLLKKREKEVNKFLEKNKDNLFEISDEEKKGEKKKEKGPLDVKHLDLELSKKDRWEVRKKVFLFKFKLRLKNLYYSILPLFLVFHFFKIKFVLRGVFKDFFRKVNFILKRAAKKISRIFKRIFESLKKKHEKLKKLISKLKSFFKKKKKGEKKESGQEKGEDTGKESDSSAEGEGSIKEESSEEGESEKENSEEKKEE